MVELFKQDIKELKEASYRQTIMRRTYMQRELLLVVDREE